MGLDWIISVQVRWDTAAIVTMCITHLRQCIRKIHKNEAVLT